MVLQRGGAGSSRAGACWECWMGLSGWPSVVPHILRAVLGPPPALAVLDGGGQEGELEAGLLPPFCWCGD